MAKILIIDDEATILENMTFILELEGHVVVNASSGQEGLEIFRNTPDIEAVVTDMRMPGMTGMDVLRAIHAENADVGIIILTGHGDMDNAVTAMKDGAYDYLNKPVNADKLLFTLENAVKRYSLMVENRKLQEDIIKKNAYLQGLHDSAQEILMHLAPKGAPTGIPGLRCASVYKSCDDVGGDMYGVYDMGDRIMFYVFDVTDHGILAAVITMILKAYFENVRHMIELLPEPPALDELIVRLNEEMCQNTPADMFATLLVGFYDRQARTLSYVSAGHIDQYVLHGSELETLSSTGTMVGLFDFATFDVRTLPIAPGDKLLLFTDGLTEVWENGRIVGADHIMEQILRYGEEPISTLLEDLYSDVLRLSAGKPLDDDLTIVGLEFT